MREGIEWHVSFIRPEEYYLRIKYFKKPNILHWFELTNIYHISKKKSQQLLPEDCPRNETFFLLKRRCSHLRHEGGTRKSILWESGSMLSGLSFCHCVATTRLVNHPQRTRSEGLLYLSSTHTHTDRQDVIRGNLFTELHMNKFLVHLKIKETHL